MPCPTCGGQPGYPCTCFPKAALIDVMCDVWWGRHNAYQLPQDKTGLRPHMIAVLAALQSAKAAPAEEDEAFQRGFREAQRLYEARANLLRPAPSPDIKAALEAVADQCSNPSAAKWTLLSPITIAAVQALLDAARGDDTARIRYLENQIELCSGACRSSRPAPEER